jgi:hypothetical protein
MSNLESCGFKAHRPIPQPVRFSVDLTRGQLVAILKEHYERHGAKIPEGANCYVYIDDREEHSGYGGEHHPVTFNVDVMQ